MTTTPTPESFARLSHADRVLLTILAFAGTTESRVRLFKYLSGAEAKTAADVAYKRRALSVSIRVATSGFPPTCGLWLCMRPQPTAICRAMATQCRELTNWNWFRSA